jgi:hypothetical protein
MLWGKVGDDEVFGDDWFCDDRGLGDLVSAIAVFG